jgi:prevent-host-death family protein
MSPRSVSIADLKDNLSAYLGQVRRGEEILVRDRNVSIARIVPLADVDDAEAEEASLVAAGKLRLPERPLPTSFWKRRAPRVGAEDLLKVIREGRDED